ncbi:MFS general substrate transporter [Auriscalpium vulgare]|uniref:MFS general substrate transporter n=1 Tax=Auriscalpium vulgare TaxID=40419 RepID=A0ACB8RZW5_9AGAM|nr:MFS general substrate transporter [Auriscalpium vulgare]
MADHTPDTLDDAPDDTQPALPAIVTDPTPGYPPIAVEVEIADIEHVYVEDDPRAWSKSRKTLVLLMVATASLIAGLAINIYNPAITKIEIDLHATSSQISLSLALFILTQGACPLLWTAISEIKGRKIVYVVSISLAMVGCIVAAEAKSIGVLIGMRVLQAMGSSAVMSIGAATLADIYDPSERGTMMGVYYAAPLLGPALGPIAGGVLTQLLSWRATFWFLVIWMGGVLLLFTFAFKDTFRRERSLTYQSVLRRLRARAVAAASQRSSVTVAPVLPRTSTVEVESKVAEKVTVADKDGPCGPPAGGLDLEVGRAPPMKEIKLSLTDVNPIPPLRLVLRRWNNVAILTASGLIFGFSYCIAYTCARTLEDRYGMDALDTGLVLLSFGAGSIAGSILGGRWSDRVLRRLKAANGGQSVPEMRLQSIKPAMVPLPLSVIAYAWLAEKHQHIATLCVALFFSGFFSIWIYSSTLAYIVDANAGRSSAAVALNSFFRGLTAFLFAEVAVPLQNSIGDGGLYTLWAGLLVLCELLIVLVLYKGGGWRTHAEAQEHAKRR